MKKLIFTIAVLIAAVSVNAQEVGQKWVGGSIGFESEKQKGQDSQTSYKILPEFGYQFQENLAIGVRLGYAHLETDFVNGLEDLDLGDEVNMFTINPFLRYTLCKGDLGALFVDAGVGYAHGKAKGSDDKADLIEVGFRPGVAVNVTDKVALTGNFGFIGYDHSKFGDDKVSRFALDFDLSEVRLGVSVKF